VETITARGATPGVSWDFSGIPIFPPDRADRSSQPSSPLAATPLPGAIQAKLIIGQVNDPLEHEADRVADQVMRMPDPNISIAVGPSQISRKCPACEEEAKTLRTKSATPPKFAADRAPNIVSEVLRSPGQPLEAGARSFFKPHFGRDFSNVRIHDDPQAAASARAIGALAYTAGHHVVFGAAQYQPGTSAGRQLLAHELTHVVQQHGTDDQRVQRTCGPELGEPAPDCEYSNASVIGWQFMFVVNCNDLQPGEVARVAAFASGLKPGAELRVHGFASEEGPINFNLSLSCHRANVIAEMLRTARPDCIVTTVLKHGAHGGPPIRDFWRSVVVEEVKPAPEAKAEVCGPDVTQWFLDEVAHAKTDRVVLEIQANLAGAHRVAASYGFSAEDVTEGGVAKKLLAEEARVGSPKRTAEASAQLAASQPGQAAFGRAVTAGTAPIPFAGAPEQIVLLAIKRASLAWKGLVGTGKRYDFKNDPSTMKGPHSDSCPISCSNTITFCPSAGSDCFGTDLPGNLFYAHIGRFVGFTELALQLGSQFAQLESSSHWDPPEDTAMISAGFRLPDPLDHAALCSAMASLRSSVARQNCRNCLEVSSASIV
jgi:outer membrane protein OmpA-like peptidoglycan-associated protein